MSKDTSTPFKDKVLKPLETLFCAQPSHKIATSPKMARVDRGVVFGSRVIGSFEISRFATTKKEWRDVFWWATENNFQFSRGSAPSDDHSMTNISLYDCLTWCNAKSEMENLSPCYYYEGEVFKDGKIIRCQYVEEAIEFKRDSNGYRVPTDIEWYWASIGAQKSMGFKYSGSDCLDSVAWYGSKSRGPCAVGRKAPNEIGAYDMSGNVWEWVWSEGTFPRPCCGGCWESSSEDCEINRSVEYKVPAYYANDKIGFRFIRALDCFPQNGALIENLREADVRQIVNLINSRK